MRQTIRTKLLALLVVPVLLMSATAVVLLSDAISTREQVAADSGIIESVLAADQTLLAMQTESLLSVALLNEDASVDRAALDSARAATDAAAVALIAATEPDAAVSPEVARATVIPGLAETRASLDTTTGDGREFATARQLSALTQDLLTRLAVAETLIDDSNASAALAALSDLIRLRQSVVDQGNGVLVAIDGGTSRDTTLIRTVGSAAEREVWLSEFAVAAPSLGEQASDLVAPMAAFDGVAVAEGQAGDPDAVVELVQSSLTGLSSLTAPIEQVLDDRAVAAQADANTSTAVAAGLLALALLVGVGVPVLVNRQVLRPVKTLSRFASDLRTHLPAAVEGAQAGGEAANIRGALDSKLSARADELGLLADAVATAGQEAIDVAVGQARLRDGVSSTIADLADRTHSSVDLVLERLDALQSSETDPRRLEELFALDHLVVRLRRHADSLRAITGQQRLGDTDEEPLRLYDVILSAASEHEGYKRVETTSMSRLNVAGWAVTPTVQLLSNLLDNALRFSPPDRQVVTNAIDNGDGSVMVSVRDFGLGMTAEAIDAAMSRIVDPPLLEAASTHQLGLYVTGLIAKDTGITVVLSSPQDGYGGTQADVVIPAGLLIDPSTGYPPVGRIMDPADDDPPSDPHDYDLPVADDSDVVPGQDATPAKRSLFRRRAKAPAEAVADVAAEEPVSAEMVLPAETLDPMAGPRRGGWLLKPRRKQAAKPSATGQGRAAWSTPFPGAGEPPLPAAPAAPAAPAVPYDSAPQPVSTPAPVEPSPAQPTPVQPAPVVEAPAQPHPDEAAAPPVTRLPSRNRTPQPYGSELAEINQLPAAQPTALTTPVVSAPSSGVLPGGELRADREDGAPHPPSPAASMSAQGATPLPVRDRTRAESLQNAVSGLFADLSTPEPDDAPDLSQLAAAFDTEDA